MSLDGRHFGKLESTSGGGVQALMWIKRSPGVPGSPGRLLQPRADPTLSATTALRQVDFFRQVLRYVLRASLARWSWLA
jgi:hypothetical protein